MDARPSRAAGDFFPVLIEPALDGFENMLMLPTRDPSLPAGGAAITLIGAVAMGVWGFVYFALMNTAIPGWIFLAIMLSLIAHDMMWGPQGALIAECFTPRLRYSGFSLGFHLASITAGGPARLIATALLAATGSGYAIALYILFCAFVTVASTIFLPDRTNRDISQEVA
jgi:hypothetical protein